MRRLEPLIHRIAKAMAYLGGIVLLALVVITCLSVIGRNLNSLGHLPFVESAVPGLAGMLRALGSIKGDFELVEAGIAFSIMAFLPWCQMTGRHATVDVMTAFIPSRANRFLDLVWDVLFAFVMVVITWRLYVGMTDKMRYGETTFLLQFPIWWAFALCLLAAVVATLVTVYVAMQRVAGFLPGGGRPAAKHEAGKS